MTARALLSDLPAYTALKEHAVKLQYASLEGLFNADSNRADTFTASAAGLHLDYSKHLLSSSALASLLDLAEQAGVQHGIEALFTGAHVNNTEDRPALHTLLRASSGGGQEDRFLEVQRARERMQVMAQKLYRGEHTGYSGKTITDVINIGIGGSDLGPRLVTQALKPFQGTVQCHYVSNVDPADLLDTLANLDAASTAFIICSKSFRTEETLANGLAARNWMLNAGATTAQLDKHFLAVTTNLQAARDFGIPEENCLPMWDWVGGRYSVWSAVGLSCAIAVGWDRFSEFLAGAEAMDQHFRNSAAHCNLPLLMSLLEIWYCIFFHASNHVVLPYDHSLQRFPDFLQQLTMESNGKRVSADGRELDYATAPVLWGSAGTMGQHSFHQLLHQGTLLCPVDFILPLNTHTKAAQQHRILVANCLAQSRTLMVGRSLEDATNALMKRGLDEDKAATLAPHLVMPGNRPSSVITMASLDPGTLGALLALYEHRTYCSGLLWRINSFDQWGVELGKEISTEILGQLAGTNDGSTMDAATDRLIKLWKDAQR
ncbi:MAG: glucose-6-phosphate isomerase [Halioglobus sp.]|nr:glucose-6-phosphate isomerase [Halioglobus sp.]